MSWGGARRGAGRPKGQGKYGQRTKPMRVPENMLSDIEDFIRARGYEIPLYASSVSAGMALPADEDIEERIDLSKYLISDPASTFLVRASGDSMIEAGISSGDILVVDKVMDPACGKIVVASIDGHLTVKRFRNKDGRVLLQAENPDYSDIIVEDGSDLVILGIVTSILRKL